jgi:phage terminase large subunit
MEAGLKLPKTFQFLFEGDYRYRAAFGGRGSAKSHSFAAALIIKARARPMRILCCREIQDSIKDSVKRLLDDKIDAMGFGGFFISTATEIRGANGSRIMFGGLRSNPDAIKSLEGVDIAWVEEASRVSERSLEILIPTIRKPNSEIWFTWNPEDPKDPVDVMFRGKAGPPPRTAIKGPVNFDCNPWFPEVLRSEMEWTRSRDPDKYAHIWLGEYRRNSEARVFHNWRVEDFDTPADVGRFYYGADFGFSVDPAVLVRCYIDGRNLYVDHEAWQVGCEIDRLPDLFDKVPDSRKWPITADSSNPQIISHLCKHGFPSMGPSKKGPGSIEDGVEFLKSFDIVVHPRCRHVIDELTLYSYEVDQHTGEVLPKLADKKNHTIDALRYAIEKYRRSQPLTFAPVFAATAPRNFPG